MRSSCLYLTSVEITIVASIDLRVEGRLKGYYFDFISQCLTFFPPPSELCLLNLKIFLRSHLQEAYAMSLTQYESHALPPT
jgi:hypothetical protein